ncbi:hypothetical protein HMN09_00461200 [Mycena chlorophos]|uniref:Uncharacterized protein n=1 Tax=Mycena chlorophos TaxID=658473 RepID=A0A8H6TIE9_MYCCL|nr:hypothetical protein HMN09_00461200 [Mycena chlorophos]
MATRSPSPPLSTFAPLLDIDLIQRKVLTLVPRPHHLPIADVLQHSALNPHIVVSFRNLGLRMTQSLIAHLVRDLVGGSCHEDPTQLQTLAHILYSAKTITHVLSATEIPSVFDKPTTWAILVGAFFYSNPKTAYICFKPHFDLVWTDAAQLAIAAAPMATQPILAQPIPYQPLPPTPTHSEPNPMSKTPVAATSIPVSPFVDEELEASPLEEYINWDLCKPLSRPAPEPEPQPIQTPSRGPFQDFSATQIASAGQNATFFRPSPAPAPAASQTPVFRTTPPRSPSQATSAFAHHWRSNPEWLKHPVPVPASPIRVLPGKENEPVLCPAVSRTPQKARGLLLSWDESANATLKPNASAAVRMTIDEQHANPNPTTTVLPPWREIPPSDAATPERVARPLGRPPRDRYHEGLEDPLSEFVVVGVDWRRRRTPRLGSGHALAGNGYDDVHVDVEEDVFPGALPSRRCEAQQEDLAQWVVW